MSTRTIRDLHRAERDDIGELETRRPLPGRALPHLDPFLFLNHHGPQLYPAPNRGLPFGPHPHRGFETVTFIVAGDLVHRDSSGGDSRIGPGGVQWMTAGRGIVHAELSSPQFKREGGPLEILQLWVNLPARLKMTEPRYVGLQAEDIPTIALDEGKVQLHLIAGRVDEPEGPVRPLTDMFMATVSLRAGGQLRLPVAAGRTVFLYVVRGAIRVGGQAARAFHLVELGDGDEVAFEATQDALVLFGHALPFREPIVADGPFVMNTRQEIVQAMNDYAAGKFGEVHP
jgi:quercetin 2,3-dioxygenase